MARNDAAPAACSSIGSTSFGALRDGFRGCLTHGLGHRGASVAAELDAPTFCGCQRGFRAL